MQVRANQTAIVAVDGMPFTVRDGDAFDDSADVVREHRWLFVAPVESASAAPGERRDAVRKS